MSTVYLDIFGKDVGVQVVGLADIVPGQADKRAAEYGVQGAVTGEDFRRVLDACSPDFVVDLTVPSAHEAVTVESLRRGCHVLGEKPLSDSMASARRMVECAEKSGRLYAVMQNRRYDRNLRRLRALVHGGALGATDSVHCDFFVAPRFPGFRTEMAHVLLEDMAIHHFDALRCLTGADAATVLCHEWNPRGSIYRGGASVVATFEMTDGSVYSYRGSWWADGLPTSWECEWRVVGEKGSAKWDGSANITAQELRNMEKNWPAYSDLAVPDAEFPGKEGGHWGCVNEFLRCVREGTTPETICTDNIRSLAMVFAAIESASAGKRVKVAP
jgi:predicted dehydrogenase